MQYLLPPWKHQLDIIERARLRDYYAIFAEVGTGKSGMAVNILRHKYFHHGKVLRTLILCPPVVCINWQREFKLHSKVEKFVRVLSGPGKKRLKTFLENSEPKGEHNTIFVTNYESMLMKDLYQAIVDWQPQVLVCDESHQLRNYKAKRTKAVTHLADITRYRFLLSGTPILNSPMDIFAQFRILDRGASFGRNFFEFRARWFVDKNATMPQNKYFPNWQPRNGLDEEFNKRIYKVAARVKKEDCLDLPPLVRKQYFCEMSPPQKRMYEGMKKDFISYVTEDKACIATIALTKALRLQQIVTGFAVLDSGETISYEQNPRLELARDLLRELTPEHKVIVWACFKQNYTDLEAMLEQEKIEYCRLYGGIAASERQASIDRFQDDPACRVIVANQNAGGIGISLTSASYSLYYSRNFSLEADLQSEARNHRGGSEKFDKITRIDLVCPGTIDESVLGALYRKENMAKSILEFKDKV